MFYHQTQVVLTNMHIAVGEKGNDYEYELVKLFHQAIKTVYL